MKKFKLIFVCTGNTCRSPMAQFMMEDALRKKKKLSSFSVSSAGLAASDGDPLNEKSAAALRKAEVKFGDFKSRRFTLDMARKSDLVVTMTALQKIMLGQSVSLDNIVSANEIIGKDVTDPYGGSVDDYCAAADDIKLLVQKLSDELAQAEKKSAKKKSARLCENCENRG